MKKRKRPSTWGGGAGWVGRKSKNKGVFGVALHTGTSTDVNGPSLIYSALCTPAVGDHVAANEEMLRRLNTRQTHTGGVPVLSVVADPAYTTKRGLSAMKGLGVEPTFRLHATNQAGPRVLTPKRARAGKLGKVPDQLLVDGWPTCTCCPDDLQKLEFPKFPAKKKQFDAYKAEIKRRDPFNYEANGQTRPDGSRRFLAPHRGTHPGDNGAGGCVSCTNPDGTPVLDPDTGLPRIRCCTKPSIVLDKDELVLAHDIPYAEPSWWPRWNIRNRVEGSYGIMKNLALMNWHRDFHRYVGVAREAMIAAFAICAHNFHMIRSWKAAIAAGKAFLHGDEDDYGFGADHHTGHEPAGVSAAIPAPEEVEKQPPKRRLAKALSFLDTDG